ncbi:MAG TPA: MFS transporter [Streptosporangiaceae bacterium]|nr:MFS transporter [Streptosporangiaceae bacterium]
MAEQFRLRSVAVAAFGPAILFGLAEGAMLPVIALSSVDRGASTAIAALITALLGVGSLVTNIPSGILATRIGERRSMLVAAAVAGTGLILCLVNLGRGGLSLVVFGSGVLLLGAASSVYTLARQSYLTEIVPREMRARALSTLGGTLRIGMFAGPFLGAGAEELWGLPGAYYVSLAAMTGAAVTVYRVPDLDKSEEHKAAAAEVTSWGILKRYWRTFATLGTGVVLLQAIRQTRQVVIPLWAAHIGLPPTASSVIYGIAGLIDLMTFYPAGKVMDLHGRRWVAVPCAAVLGISFVVMPFTHAASTLTLTAVIMGFGNGIGSGIVMTLAADTSPEIGRPKFLGLWRELSDAGQGTGPLILSAVTAVAGLAAGITVTGVAGFAAAAAMWSFIPRPPRPAKRHYERQLPAPAAPSASRRQQRP